MFTSITKGKHQHKYFVDGPSGDVICLCGKLKGESDRKYHNVPSEYKGVIYDSAFEASYAAELDYRIKSGEIIRWDRQVKIDLRSNGFHIANYYIDFIVYYPDKTKEYVEVKGKETESWRMKWRLLEAMLSKRINSGTVRMLLVKLAQDRNWLNKVNKKNEK